MKDCNTKNKFDKMKMKTKLMTLLTALTVVVFLSSCGKVPQAEIDAAVWHYATGVTITDVARRIGISRSAAAGILHRAGALGKRGLGGGATVALMNRVERGFGVPSGYIVLAPPLPVFTSVPEPVSQRVPIIDAEGCRWIDKWGTCCNHKQHGRSSYCKHHFEKSQKKNEAQQVQRSKDRG